MDGLLVEILCQLRAMQLFYHNSHHNTKGPGFEGDHELFNDFYTELDGEYDSMGERLIGLSGKPLNLLPIIVKIHDKLMNDNISDLKDNQSLFLMGLKLELTLQSMCNEVDKSTEASAGLKQLVGGFADTSESRTYKIKQRIK